MKRFIHTIAETTALMYCLAVLMAIYATGAIAMCGTPSPAWYGTLITIVLSAPILTGIAFAAVKITKAINYRTPGKRLGTIPREAIVKALCATK